MIELSALGELKEDERVENGVIYCTKCGGARSDKIEIYPTGDVIYFRKECECQKKDKEMRDRIVQIRKNCGLSKRYKDVSFDSSKEDITPDFKVNMNRCKGYCDHAKEARENGWGIYLFGNKGTGKTHLAACIANELISGGYEVLFTNFFEITKEIKSTFNKSSDENEKDLIERITAIDFLIIDDIGTETLRRGSEDTWMQEKVYDVLNNRYNAKKPTIFTSNNSFAELVNERGMMDKTVDRIMEMSTMILKFEGQSYRKEVRKVRLPF